MQISYFPSLLLGEIKKNNFEGKKFLWKSLICKTVSLSYSCVKLESRRSTFLQMIKTSYCNTHFTTVFPISSLLTGEESKKEHTDFQWNNVIHSVSILQGNLIT